jgi:hypothetical protein
MPVTGYATDDELDHSNVGRYAGLSYTSDMHLKIEHSKS